MGKKVPVCVSLDEEHCEFFTDTKWARSEYIRNLINDSDNYKKWNGDRNRI